MRGESDASQTDTKKRKGRTDRDKQSMNELSKGHTKVSMSYKKVSRSYKKVIQRSADQKVPGVKAVYG